MSGARTRRQTAKAAAASSQESELSEPRDAPAEAPRSSSNGTAHALASEGAEGDVHENIFLFWPNLIGTRPSHVDALPPATTTIRR